MIVVHLIIPPSVRSIAEHWVISDEELSTMEMVTHALNWFEIPVNDFDRARLFYSTIFDFEMPVNPTGLKLMGFLLYDFQARGVGGAIVKGEGFTPSEQGSLLYLNGGSDLTVVLDRIEPAGGTIVTGKTEIGRNLGYFAIFRDTEGNKLALHSMG